MLARTDILVCLLPLTPATRGILNGELFAKLPRGACLINVGRGGHQVERDLLEALDSGQLREATLDVFEEEPLPADSPLWSHPQVIVTPHIASMTMPETAAKAVGENIKRMEAIALNVVDRRATDRARRWPVYVGNGHGQLRPRVEHHSERSRPERYSVPFNTPRLRVRLRRASSVDIWFGVWKLPCSVPSWWTSGPPGADPASS